jgi:hypothetical protein
MFKRFLDAATALGMILGAGMLFFAVYVGILICLTQ